MRAVVLEQKGKIAIRDISLAEHVGARDVRIKIDTVGVCGSDVHYYEEGAIGQFVVREPMVLGHEASGIVVELGKEVSNLEIGDRVCMEPGIPDWMSAESRSGWYNLDPAVRFWATPPIHGCLRDTVVHPAALTFKLPDRVSMEEGAFVEPLAIGVHAAEVASIKPGDRALVLGCGTIGLVTALAALAAGCSDVVVTDVLSEKLRVTGRYPKLTAIEATDEEIRHTTAKLTGGRGFEVVFDASGSARAIAQGIAAIAPKGNLVLIGMPSRPVPIDIVQLQMREATVKTIFRYANDFERAIALIASGSIDVKPMISKVFPFERSVDAFELASSHESSVIKLLIKL